MSDGEPDLEREADPLAARRLACRPAPRPRRSGAEVVGGAPRRRTLVTDAWLQPCDPSVWDSQRMGEFELLAQLRERLPRAGRRGCASAAATTPRSPCPAAPPRPRSTRWSTGVHFRRERRRPGARSAARRSPPRSPTWRRWAPSRARPTSSSASRPTSTRTSCLELLDGIAALAAETGTTLAGGDVTRAPVLTLAVTVVGHAPGAERLRHPRRRPARRRPRPHRRARRRRGRPAAARAARARPPARRRADDRRARCAARQLEPRAAAAPPAGPSPRPGRRR